MPLRSYGRALRRHRDLLLDTAVALLLYGLFAGALLVNPTDPMADVPWLGVEGYLAGALATLPLALRRRAPGLVLAAVGTGAIHYKLLQASLDGPSHPVLVMATFVAIFSAGVHGRPLVR